MKQRLTVNECGELCTRDGIVLGRITSVTVDWDEANLRKLVGTIGGTAVDVSTELDNPPSPQVGEGDGQLFEAPDNVQVVWEHYQAKVKGASRRKLDSTRKGLIRNALKVRPLETVLKAIDGLATSPWHNGQNDQRTEYLDIRYALKGNSQRGESNEARIDQMAGKAGESDNSTTTVAQLLASVPSGAADLVRLRMQRAREFAEATPDQLGSLSAQGEEALRQLREAPPHIEPVTEPNGDRLRLVGWRRV